MRELSLQTTAHQYMMESDAQHQTTPISFQEIPSPPRAVSPSERYIPDGQNTQLSQIIIDKQLNFWVDHQGLGYRFLI